MKTNTVLAVSVMAAVLALGSAAKASVIFDGLPGTTIGWGPISSGQTYAQSFTTDAQSWTLESVTLPLTGYTLDGTFAVHLYDSTGTGGTPGSPLLTLDGNDNPSYGQYSYTGSLALSPNTTYWVEADVNPASDSFYEWNVTPDAPTVGSGFGFAYSDDGGSTWGLEPSMSLETQVNANPYGRPRAVISGVVGRGCLGICCFAAGNNLSVSRFSRHGQTVAAILFSGIPLCVAAHCPVAPRRAHLLRSSDGVGGKGLRGGAVCYIRAVSAGVRA
jgi:hypothetical protein